MAAEQPDRVTCAMCGGERQNGEPMVLGRTGAAVCAGCVVRSQQTLEREEREDGDHPMPIAKPVRWAWLSRNVIGIYTPTDRINGGVIYLQLWTDDEEGFDYANDRQAEKTAQFVVDAISEKLERANARK